ncbi:MAG: 50S ribosomal protein L30e [Candidatus Micrarchaeota archaeon]|nr:50S ribosomal protein L30e [Candidatus Micrarchaeota archaeon]
MARKKSVEIEEKKEIAEKKELEEKEEEAAEEVEAAPEKKKRKAITRKREKKEKISPLEKEIRLLIDSGKVEFGTRKGISSVLLGKAKGLIFASNIRRETLDDLNYYSSMNKKMATLPFSGTSMELGKLCGKPFPISIIAIFEFGETTKDKLEKLTKG